MERIHCALSLKALGIDEVSAKANYDSKLQIDFLISLKLVMKYSTSLFHITNLGHAFITVSSRQNIFAMEIFTSGTLSRIHAPHRIGWPVLTYQSPIALDENIRSIYRLTPKSLSCVIQTSLVEFSERLVLRCL